MSDEAGTAPALDEPQVDDATRLRRWRLLLGEAGGAIGGRLTATEDAMDGALGALYDTGPGGRSAEGADRSGGQMLWKPVHLVRLPGDHGRYG